MNKEDNLNALACELAGIQGNLLILGGTFAYGGENKPHWNDDIVADTLFSMASHIERISKELNEIQAMSELPFFADSAERAEA